MTPAASLELRVHDGDADQPMPCRVHLTDGAGKPVRPTGFPFWHDHFVCNGTATLELPPGDYEAVIERGPEYAVSTNRLHLTASASPLTATVRLQRLTHLAREGWWAGDLHVHRPLTDIELLLEAEDLHITPVITWWNSRGPWNTTPRPAEPVIQFDGNRFYAPLAGEDERGGGALLYFGLNEPLPLDGSSREYPPSLAFLRQAKATARTPGTDPAGPWAEIEKPFWWDVPVWLASGLADSVGIAHNHLQRGGVLENEAWGRPRDLARYPGPQGNGRYTQDLYYHILNSGLRLPPSAGSASGVLPNPVGYNRAYVHVEGELTWEKWWAGLRAGRVFVSNGPLLRVRANGHWPGHLFTTNAPLSVLIEGQLDSRDPITAVELVRNGRVETITLPRLITVDESGWFLVRATADVPRTFRFASTGPWYVQIGSRTAPPAPGVAASLPPERASPATPRLPLPVRRESAQFFLEWTRERAANVTKALANETQRAAALEPLLMAEQFWRDKVAQSISRTSVLGNVSDEATGETIPCRLYVQDGQGRWLFAESSGPDSSAVRYERQNWLNRNAVENHTTLSAHPFHLELEPGRYSFTVERGKEYRPLVRELEVGTAPVELRLPLGRWVNMAARGWYSGDTHVHRTLAELPNVMLAEDLNVAFPLTYWVTKGFAPPTLGDKNTDAAGGDALIRVDATHVIWPRNTEWEIFTLGERRHTLGAVFALGHRTPLEVGAPPVGPVAEAARRDGALLDLDKHDWPWAMALVPVMGVDLFELANNHLWRTEFGFTNWTTPAPAWMGLPHEGRGGSEKDWTLYGFQNYYALLNCGFRLRPTAGTASGVHPVPLGFGRVYVHLPDGFSYQSWLKGLDAGRSFVTTGPMALVTLEGHGPGHRFAFEPATQPSLRLAGEILSETPVELIEVVVNGTVARQFRPESNPNQDGASLAQFDETLQLDGSAWLAVRCWESRPGGRMRFAHTAPWFVDVEGAPLRPKRHEVEFLVERVQNELDRSRGLLPPTALDEYRQALAAYQRLLESAVP